VISFSRQPGGKPVAEKPPFLTETLEVAPEEPTTGSTFAGRYHIVEELGKGGMGRVYRAIDKKLNEEVALKLIKPEIARDEHTLDRFQNELKIARKISHRHVGRMYELMEEKGVHFITMEYVAGQDLRGLIRQTGQLTVRKAISIAKQVLEGLAEAHRLGVVHRDLKPSNIIIDREGSARIIDFGIARASGAKGKTGEGAIIGTPEYMAPEQVEGKPADRRADLYALGVILFEMVTGRPPFEGETPLGVAVKHKTEPPPDPHALAPQIPAELGRVILRSLEKDRDKRYQTSEEFLADLAAVDEALPTTERTAPSRKPTISKKITVEFTPKKLLIPAAGVAVLVLAALFLWHPWSSPKSAAAVPKVERSIAVISFENLTGDSRHDGLIKAVPNLMITKFEAMGIPYVASWERLRDILKQIGKDPDAPIDKESGFEVCRREGIAVLVTGEVARAGNVFVTNIKALDVGTKGSLASASAQGQGEESILLSQIDDLAGRVYQKLGWSLPRAGAASPVSEFTTTSMEAYNDFLKGRDLYEKYYFEDARQALQQAVDRDPGFAVAHLYLAHVYGGLRLVKLQEETYKKAEALSDKASEKERLYIEAAYAGAVEKDPQKRFGLLQELAAKYPREKLAHVNLAGYYRGKKMFPEAIGELDKALGLDPNYGRAFEFFAYVYMDMGEMGKATEYLKKYTAVNPGDADPYAVMGDLYFHAGGLDEAIASYREALKLKPSYGVGERTTYIRAVKGDYREALRSIDDYIQNAQSRGLQGRGLMWRSYYDHVTGRRDLAMKEADQTIEGWTSVNPYGVSVIKMLEAWFCYDRGEYEKGRRLMQDYFDFNESYDPPSLRTNTLLLEHYLALLDVKQGRIESAKQRVDKTALILAQAHSEDASWRVQGGHLHLRRIAQAEIGFAEGMPEEVISLMEKEMTLTIPGMNPPELMVLNMPFEQDVLARAYRKAGNVDKAIEVYRKLLTFDPASQDRRIHIPVYHYRLARLYEEKGLRDKAAEQYRVFLDLWKDADPGLPEVADAKKRLAGLSGT
jgi:serine/threonine protein kinase/tetratricopeptide (TPR) repeat protein